MKIIETVTYQQALHLKSLGFTPSSIEQFVSCIYDENKNLVLGLFEDYSKGLLAPNIEQALLFLEITKGITIDFNATEVGFCYELKHHDNPNCHVQTNHMMLSQAITDSLDKAIEIL